MTNNKDIISQFQNLFTKAKNLENLEKYQEAINCYDEVINLAEDKEKYKEVLIGAYLNKGGCLFRLEEFEEEINCYDEVIKVINLAENNQEEYKENLIKAYLNKAFCLSRLKDFEDVINCYDEVIKAINLAQNQEKYREKLIIAYYGKGCSYSELKNTKESKEKSKEAFENYFKEIVKTSSDEKEKIKDQKLFRFKEININTLKELINNQLYTSFPKDDFNDPFDCNYEHLDKAEFHNQFKKVRISCFSMSDHKNIEPYKNKLMWSYYARGHQGICIEYELQTDSFDQDNIGFFTVKYDNSRNFLPVAASAYCTKASGWRHENEVRMIRYIEEENENKLSNSLLDLKDSKLLKIKNIYLGLKISDSDKDTIIKIVRDNLENIKIFKMMADIATNFDMHYEEIKYK